jgi:hypothetical protein
LFLVQSFRSACIIASEPKLTIISLISIISIYYIYIYKLKCETEKVFLASSKERHVRLHLPTKFHIILLFLPLFLSFFIQIDYLFIYFNFPSFLSLPHFFLISSNYSSPHLFQLIPIIIFLPSPLFPLTHVLLTLPIILPIFSLPRFFSQTTPRQTSSSHKISHHSSISSNYFSPFLFKLIIYLF